MRCEPVATMSSSGMGPGPKIKQRCAQAGNALFVFGGFSVEDFDAQDEDDDELDDNLYILNLGDNYLTLPYLTLPHLTLPYLSPHPNVIKKKKNSCRVCVINS